MITQDAARIINAYFCDAPTATRARMLAAAGDPERTLVECRTAIRQALDKVPARAGANLKPLTVEAAADIINRHFEELPAPVRVRMLRAFNICRPHFDLDYTRLVVESEFRLQHFGG